MMRLAAKLGFVHRTLWRRGQAYRWAALLGPPPLLGCAAALLALAAWRQLPHVAAPSGGDAPWAQWTRPVPRDGQPYAEAPAAPLPATDASGGLVGFQPGWTVEFHAMSMDTTMEVNLLEAPLSSFTLSGPTVPLARRTDAGAPDGLFMVTAQTDFVARTPGLYAFSARLAWSGAEPADCLVRFGSARHAMIRNLNLKVPSQSTLSYPPTEFRVEPGLLLLQAATGCWRGGQVAGPGALTVMVRRPGEAIFTPAAADELVRPARRAAAGSR